MDLTVLAIPGYFASMAGEALYLRRRAEREGPAVTDYETRDTVTSLTMGVGSLLAPVLAPRLLKPFTPGRGRFGKALVVTAVGAAAVTTVADLVARRTTRGADVPPGPAIAERVAAVGGVATVVTGGIAVTSTWASRTTADRMWARRLGDLGTGPAAIAAALVGWDFLYYCNHRLMHESRFMWAIHVVHHSSQRYNLSTALRQPVADALGTFVPYSLLALVGVRPSLIEKSRGLNLLYQYWIHTDAVRTLGVAEEVLNTPSHHRVHHGSNRKYLDRNHGGILITWDRLLGTFQREEEPVVYGLTTNIGTFNPLRVASHEHAAMLRDVARSRTWRDRVSFVVRGPGWAGRRRAQLGWV